MRSSDQPHQIDEGEDPDPDEIEEVPEHAERREPLHVRRHQTALADLNEQGDQPDQARGDVQTVGADKREEGRQEGRAVRPRADMHEVAELVDFHADEARAEERGDHQPGHGGATRAGLGLQHREAEGDRRDQQQRGFHRDEAGLEQVLRAGPAGIVAAEHRIGREQAAEDDAVAHQVDPEPDRGRAGMAGAVVMVMGLRGGEAGDRPGPGGVERGHAVAPFASVAATVVAGMK
ncbi:hypothetical protein SDC9_37642 [bioreactor metagenome]|uniref:Uncharacterized protein n=1 Tax=bioreactor metagenome TaxID=1076179 RepID=A0A644VJZ5_9ZZZZ